MLETLAADPEWLAAKVVLLYADMPDEVPMWPVIERWKTEKTLLLPAIRQGELLVCPYRGRGDLRAGVFGLLEPTASPYPALESIDLALIPGVAFRSQRRATRPRQSLLRSFFGTILASTAAARGRLF